MRKTIIRKRGKERLIYIPDKEEMAELRGILDALNNKAMNVCDTDTVHGFMPGRSPVTNAKRHIGFGYTLNFDLKDFFESVTPEKVSKYLSTKESSAVFVDNAARQGLPTSPAVANLAAVGMDTQMDKMAKRVGEKYNDDIVYTRYADDLSISFNNPELIDVLKSEVKQTVSRCGFKLNEKKTNCQCSKAGRRVICGVAVGEDGIYPTRNIKRKIRAAQHRGNTRKLRGLQEWAKLKEPESKEDVMNRANIIREAKELNKHWKLKRVNFKKCVESKLIEDGVLGNDCFITNDPVYIMGMSTFTSGWTSCTRQEGANLSGKGSHNRSVMAMVCNESVSLAIRLGDSTRTICGVTRQNMLARAILTLCTDGKVYYSRMYGNGKDISILENELNKAGIKSVVDAGNTAVHGKFKRGMVKPYLDNFRLEDIGDCYEARR